MKKHKDKFVLSILKKVEKGAMSVPDAATRLGCTRQYVNKLRRRYKVENESFLIHGNKGKTRRWKTSQELEARIITLYSEKYLEFNFSHFLEKLNEQEHISISYKPLYRILKTPELIPLNTTAKERLITSILPVLGVKVLVNYCKSMLLSTTGSAMVFQRQPFTGQLMMPPILSWVFILTKKRL